MNRAATPHCQSNNKQSLSNQSERDDSLGLKRARTILRRNEVRRMELSDGRVVTSVWSNLDSETIRTAWKLTGLDQLPIQYIDSPANPRSL